MTECSACGGPIWDNREKVRGGWKGPLYKCKDKACGAVIWPPKDKAAEKRATAPDVKGPKWTWGTLGKTYERCLLVAEMRVQAMCERQKLPVTVDGILAATATLFISASRDGVAEPKIKLPPKPIPHDAQELEEDDDTDMGF